MAADDTKRFFTNSAYMTREGIAAVNARGKELMARLRTLREQRRERERSERSEPPEPPVRR